MWVLSWCSHCLVDWPTQLTVPWKKFEHTAIKSATYFLALHLSPFLSLGQNLRASTRERAATSTTMRRAVLSIILTSFSTNVLRHCVPFSRVSTKVNPGLKWSALLYGSSYNCLSTDVACVSRWGNAIYRMCSVPKLKRPTSQPLTLLGRGSLIMCFRNSGIVKRGRGRELPYAKKLLVDLIKTNRSLKLL